MNRRYVPPLHVHILCRAASPQPAQDAAKALDRYLQGDPLVYAVSPVDIPTFRIPVGPGGPGQIRWADAERHAIVVFVDDEMFRDREVWGPWMDRLVADADENGALVLTVTHEPEFLSSLSPNLARKQVIRVPSMATVAPDVPVGVVWEVEVMRRVFRALATQLAESGQGLGRLFLSHAKRDGLWLAAALRDELARFAGDLAFFDGVSLREGEEFDEGLIAGFDGAVVVGLVTDTWSGRYWCTWEVVKGKERRCPFLSVDLLSDGEVRSVRYAGNARTLRWPLAIPTPEERNSWAPAPHDSTPEANQKRLAIDRIVIAALVELVRARHDRARIEAVRAAGVLPDDTMALGAPPELATLPGFEADRSWLVVHPDPALPLAERELIARQRPDVKVASLTEALAGRFCGADPSPLRVAVSISDPPSDDLDSRGLTKDHLVRLWSRVALQLLLAGARLGYGGDLRRQGYTERLGDLLMSLASVERGPRPGYVHGYLGWPVWDGVPADEWKRYPHFVTWHKLRRPDGLDIPPGMSLSPAWSEPEVQLGWTVSMLAMRERMARYHDARILVGGQHTAVSPVPGLADELTTFLDLGRPVYLLGGFGGMTSVLGRALVGEDPEELELAYQDVGGTRTSVREAIDRAAGTRTFVDPGEERIGGVVDAGRPVKLERTNFPALLERLHRTGLGGLQNGLDDAENRRLLSTRDPVEAIALVLRGLASVQPVAEPEP